MGIPPTGKMISVTGIDITRWSNGKAVEHWSNEDIMGMMQQLGVIPMQGQTG
jgi:predicted ester cyclase